MHLSFWKKSHLLLLTILILSIVRLPAQSPLYSNEECLECHGKSDIFQIMADGKARSLYVNPEQWSQDIHQKSQMVCVDCHKNASPYLHFREGFIDVDCARCHPEEAEEYQKNVHFEYKPVSVSKKLPLCYDCHTKHVILNHDDPLSSINEERIGQTCGNCHAEVMVESLMMGGALGKISGHRKGDLSERFDMKVCINCHYDDAAHGAKRVYKDFCIRCHDARSPAGFVVGPTHLNSQTWSRFNFLSSGLVLFFVVGIGLFFGYRSRKGIVNGMTGWYDSMKIKDEETLEGEKTSLSQPNEKNNTITQ